MKLVTSRHRKDNMVEGTSVLPARPGKTQCRQAPRWLLWLLLGSVALAGIVLLVLILLGQREQDVTTQQAADTQQTLQEVSDPLAELCKTDPSVRARVGDACNTAQAVAEAPPAIPGPAGLPGEEGRGVVSTSIVNGNLIVRYTDDTTVNVGRVMGEPGERGEAGVGVLSSQIVEGRLILSMTDGSQRDVGRVVGDPGAVGPAGPEGAAGANGADGAAGADGRGVLSVAAVSGRLIVTFDDGSEQDAGPLPPGPAGPPGPSGEDGADGTPAVEMVLKGAGTLGADLTCTRTNADPVSPVYECA